MGPVSISVEVEWNTDGDTPSNRMEDMVFLKDNEQ